MVGPIGLLVRYQMWNERMVPESTTSAPAQCSRVPLLLLQHELTLLLDQRPGRPGSIGIRCR
jgi:hypothetical protein